MSDFTPTTEQVRIKYSMDEKYCDEAIEAKWAAEFDRWLAAHDAEVRERAAQRVSAAWFAGLSTHGWDCDCEWCLDTARDLRAAARGDSEQA